MGRKVTRNAERGTRNSRGGLDSRGSARTMMHQFRVPRSAFHVPRYVPPMSVQAIAWSPSGAVRIVDQLALPEDYATRDLESVPAVADAIRHLQVRGAPLIGIAAAMGLVAGCAVADALPPGELSPEEASLRRGHRPP